MPTEVMLAVLFGAALHAGWNALAKAGGGAGGDPLVDTTAILGSGALLSLVALVFLPLPLPLPAPASWPFLVASGLIHVAYFHLLAAAYRAGDMSLAYPLSRGTAPLLTALASGSLLGETLSFWSGTGVALTCAGVLAMLAAAQGRFEWHTAGYALANACVIALYTLVDGIGARRSGAPLAYTFGVILATAVFFLPTVARRHIPALRFALRERWYLCLGGGAAVVGSYAVALWAMTRAPIAPVAALRECSILFGIVIARFLLGERPHKARIAGGALILLGAGALRLG